MKIQWKTKKNKKKKLFASNVNWKLKKKKTRKNARVDLKFSSTYSGSRRGSRNSSNASAASTRSNRSGSFVQNKNNHHQHHYDGKNRVPTTVIESVPTTTTVLESINFNRPDNDATSIDIHMNTSPVLHIEDTTTIRMTDI